ncbi:hypothetical protein AVEN_114888-1 [Araneus ventricosus]|uniref:Uncharacterized protein n=1 Tax=Araneus ventricosus TaxID=182803 RepID=A0A4Y2S6C8_ARAVE|nr:hypothetical protein AVEN_114888-1 [Araneus ventricosus]
MAALTGADDQRSLIMKKFIARSLRPPKKSKRHLLHLFLFVTPTRAVSVSPSLSVRVSVFQFSRFLIKKIGNEKPFLYCSNPVPKYQAFSMSKEETEIIYCAKTD